MIKLSALHRFFHANITRLAGIILITGLVVILFGCGQAAHTAEEHLDRGLSFEQQGDLTAARIEYRNALQKEPGNAEGRFRLGILMLRFGDAAAAETELRRAKDQGWAAEALRMPLLRTDILQGRADRVLEDTRSIESFPEDNRAEALALRGEAYLLRNNESEAMASFAEALRLDPAQAEALMGMAWIEASRGQEDDARNRLQLVLSDNPQLGRAWEQLGDIERNVGNLRQAEDAYSRALETTHQPFSPLIKRAGTRASLGEFDSASDDVRSLQRDFPQRPEVSAVRGFIAFQQGRYAEARTDFEETLSQSGDPAPAVLLYLGLTHARLGNEEQAELFLRRHLGRVPDSVDTVYHLVSLLTEQGRTDAARRLLDASTPAFDGHQTEFTALRTQVALTGGNIEEQLSLLANLVESQPDSAELRALYGAKLLEHASRDQGLDMLRQAAALGHNDSPGSEVDTVMSQLQSGNYEQALARAQRLQEEHPSRSEPWNLIGAAFLGLGQTDKAREAFAKSLELVPGDLAAGMNLGALELQMGHPDAAREVFRSLQEHHPGHQLSGMRLAALEMQDGNLPEAMRWLRLVVEAHPDDPGPHLVLARVLTESGLAEEAIVTLRSIQTRQPDNVQVLYALGDVHLRLGQFDEAVTWLAVAREQSPENIEILWTLARAQSGANKSEALNKTLAMLLELRPTHFQARFELARSLLKDNRPEEARRHVQRLQEGYPGDASVAMLAGELAFLEDKPQEAVKWYQEALEQSSAQPSWVLRLAQAQHAAGDEATARNTLRVWLAEQPDDLEAQKLLAGWLLAAAEDDAALDIYTQLLARDATDVIALSNTAWLLRTRDTDQALEYAERAAQLAPDRATVLRTLGVVLLHAEQGARAKTVLTQAAELAPEDPDTAYHLARAHQASDEPRHAATILRKLLSEHAAFPQRESARRLLDELE